MNKEVSYALAKLLKEKNVYIWSKLRYTDFEGIVKLEESNNYVFPYAPTISDVVMWIYKNYKIWISVECDCCGQLWFAKFTTASSDLREDLEKRSKIISATRLFENIKLSLEESYEAAITCFLNNPI